MNTPTTQLDALTAHRVQVLWDRQEISDVMLRFGRGLDLHDWDLYAATLHDPFEVAAQRQVRQPELVHDTVRPGADFALGVVEQFEHQAVANQICGVQTDRPVQLEKLIGAVVRRFEFPPELEPEQTLIEAARPRAICDAQSNVVENRSATGHHTLP